jgi:hypothetical protein
MLVIAVTVPAEVPLAVPVLADVPVAVSMLSLQLGVIVSITPRGPVFPTLREGR